MFMNLIEIIEIVKFEHAHPGQQRGPEMAMRAADRICEALCDTFELSNGKAVLGASVGVACSEGERVAGEDLVRRADAAMYQSKERGRCLPVLAPSD
jgi:GGDEF domain-containing protein